MEKKTPEQVIKDLRVLYIGELPFFPFHKPDDMDNETYQHEILRAHEEQAAYFARYEEAQVEILNDYVKQETERLQAENKAMRAVIIETAKWIEREADELADTPKKGAAAVMYMKLAPLTEIIENF